MMSISLMPRRMERIDRRLRRCSRGSSLTGFLPQLGAQALLDPAQTVGGKGQLRADIADLGQHLTDIGGQFANGGVSGPSPSPDRSQSSETFKSPAIIDSLLARGSDWSSSHALSVLSFTPRRLARSPWVMPARSRAPATRSPKVVASGSNQLSLVSVVISSLSGDHP